MERRFVVRHVILFGAILFNIYFFLFGNVGLFVQRRQKQDLYALEHKILLLEKSVDLIGKNISNLLNDDFYIEKVARQDLQMGLEDEIVYVLPKSVS